MAVLSSPLPYLGSGRPLPYCNLLAMIYDYTTRYEMDMPLTISKQYLLNNFIQNTLSISLNKLGIINPCGINIGCLIDDNPCNTVIITAPTG